MHISNKIILITGGATRVGRVITQTLVQAGGIVYCHYNKSKKAAESLQSGLTACSGEIHLIRGDLSDIKISMSLIEQVVNKAGRIDILVNNAAIFYSTPLEKITEKNWDDLFSINLKSPFFLCRDAGNEMKKRGSGKIINIGDTSGLNPWPGYLPYSISKSGIIAMTKGFAKALAPEVHVNCINPGPVLLPENYTEEEIQKSINKTLLKRTGNPEDIANTVKYIIEATDYLTGAIINVDGGRSIN